MGGAAVGNTTPGKRVTSRVGVATTTLGAAAVQVGRGVRVGVTVAAGGPASSRVAEQPKSASASANNAPMSAATRRFRITALTVCPCRPEKDAS